jgi:hypothetical protein
MKKLSSVLAATILTMIFALPVSAAPIFVPKPQQMSADIVEKVHDRREWRRKHYRHWRSDRHWKGRYARRDCRYYGGCYRRPYYGYNRYYGYRDYYPRYYYPRHHYRRSGVGIYLSF